MQSEEFMRRGLLQVKGSGPSGREPSETVRRSQGVVQKVWKSSETCRRPEGAVQKV
ncbi:UNVERIFIED_CONTAM: hypothetical protein Sradi_2381100 [Sesamum radiatum]|uniref:Uncharacterized protein n=1 Tax=Sesamum radiatum TaxID=300843 RepID=A0AAW2T6J6_SESRA